MRRSVIIFLGILLAVSGYMTLRRANRSMDHQSSNVAASQAQSIHKASENRKIESQAAQATVPQAESKAGRGTPAALKEYLLAHHPAAIETRIEKRDPFISRYRLLGRRKVLLSSEETHELDDMLKDREKWGQYQDYLQKVDFGPNAVAEEQMYRLFLLQYFESSFISDKDPALLDFMIAFVIKDNFGSQLSLEIKKSLAYEKIKVLGFLRQHSPESLDVIKQKMTGLRHEKLLRDFFEQAPEA